MTIELNKDTRLCISLAGRPSNINTRFHNVLYRKLGLDFIYKAFTTPDLAATIAGIRGCGAAILILTTFRQHIVVVVRETHYRL